MCENRWPKTKLTLRSSKFFSTGRNWIVRLMNLNDKSVKIAGKTYIYCFASCPRFPVRFYRKLPITSIPVRCRPLLFGDNYVGWSFVAALWQLVQKKHTGVFVRPRRWWSYYSAKTWNRRSMEYYLEAITLR